MAPAASATTSLSPPTNRPPSQHILARISAPLRSLTTRPMPTSPVVVSQTFLLIAFRPTTPSSSMAKLANRAAPPPLLPSSLPSSPSSMIPASAPENPPSDSSILFSTLLVSRASPTSLPVRPLAAMALMDRRERAFLAVGSSSTRAGTGRWAGIRSRDWGCRMRGS